MDTCRWEKKRNVPQTDSAILRKLFIHSSFSLLSENHGTFCQNESSHATKKCRDYFATALWSFIIGTISPPPQQSNYWFTHHILVTFKTNSLMTAVHPHTQFSEYYTMHIPRVSFSLSDLWNVFFTSFLDASVGDQLKVTRQNGTGCLYIRDCSLSRVSGYEGNRRSEEIALDCPTEAWSAWLLAPSDRNFNYQRIEHSHRELGVTTTMVRRKRLLVIFRIICFINDTYGMLSTFRLILYCSILLQLFN